MITFSRKTHLNAALTCKFGEAVRHLCIAMFTLWMIAICRPCTGLDWIASDQCYVLGHVYVAYTSDWVPSAQGTLVDVTTEIVADDDRGHVNDLHGNTLTIDASNNAVYDTNGQATGFVYGPAQGP